VQLALRVLSSLAILFHLMVVGLAPNPDSVLYWRVEKVLLPYANILGLNTTWRFFSPNPNLQTMYYQALGYNDAGEVIFEANKSFPEKGVEAHNAESFNRLMSASMMVSARPELFDQILTPYLCRRHPEAQEIYIYFLRNQMPSLDKAKIMGGSRDDISTTEKILIKSMGCPKADVPS
jgi:hypothetical protein